MIMSITRQLAVLLPAAYILAHAFGLHAVWYAFPIAEFASLALSIIMLSHTYKRSLCPSRRIDRSACMDVQKARVI